MRIAAIAIFTIVQLVALSAPAGACPAGYTRCGTHYCCPQ